MITNDQQLQTTLERITWFQNQVAHLRKTETIAIFTIERLITNE
jgi:hypothetical protein